MTSMITSRVAKHILKENAKNHFGTEDPYFDYVTPHDLNGNPRKVKRTKKAAPPGITPSEAKILKKVTRRAYRLDNCFSVCGIRVGWSAIFGIIPGLGDVFDVLMALMVYRTCCQADIPSSLRSRMMVNIILDFGIGLVPILGDIADAVFRANTRNAALLYAHLKERGAGRLEGGEGGLLEEGGERKASVVKGQRDHGVHGVHGVHGARETNGHANAQTSGTVPMDSAPDYKVHDGSHAHAAKAKTESKGGWFSRLTTTAGSGSGSGTGGVNGTSGGTAKAHTSRKEPDLEAGQSFS